MRWEWINGNAEQLQLENFGADQPDNNGECIEMFNQSFDFGWDDY